MCPAMARDSGFPTKDAQDDFQRARRRRVFAQLSSLLRLESGDVDVMLTFDEVVEALGFTGELDLGLRVVDIDSIVGTVDRGMQFDREFRPTSPHARARFERIAEAARRGVAMPPVDLYRIGELHFVRDGHHRVAVGRAQRREEIEAHVVEVLTRVVADSSMTLRDLPLKGHERLFHERVPLPPAARGRIALSDPIRFGTLAEAVEAWGFRLSQHDERFLDRRQAALRWFEEEYLPVVALLRDCELIGRRETETDAYLRLSDARYRIMRTQQWSDEAIERVRRGR